MVAHESQLVPVPDDLSDEAAVMVEPTACAVHAASLVDAGRVAVIGAGTLGLLTIAAGLRRARPEVEILATAKHPLQRDLARELGADTVVAPGELDRVVRFRTGTMRFDNGQLGGGVKAVVDCVGSAESIAQALRIAAPGGTIHAVGMPGVTTVDLTPLWQREVALSGRLRLPASGLRHRHRARAGPRPRPPRHRHLPPGPLRGRHRPRRQRRRARRRQDRLRPPVGTRERQQLMPRPGFVLDVDRSTPPILFHHGEGFRLEKLPAGRSRVIYPAEPLAALDDPDAAIRHALLNPLGDSDPLPALLTPGMKLTIAFDDISLPLPPMRRPDIRQRVIEAVLDLAAAAGVDDVHLIAALALHRRMTEAELRHAPWATASTTRSRPNGLLYNHDAEDPDNLAFIGDDRPGRGGRDQQAGRRQRPARLREHQPRGHGRRLEVDRHRPGVVPSLRHHHNVKTMQHSKSFMDQHKSELHSSNWRMGEVLREAGVKIFQIETTLNNDTFPSPFDFLQKREWEWTARDRATFIGMKAGLDHLPIKARRKIFNSWLAPYGITSRAGRRGRGGARGHDRQRLRAAARARRGPDRHPHHGAALHLPLQRELDHEPDPRDVPRARLLLQPLPGQAARARGRRAHHEPPDAVGVPPGPPPELHRLLRAGAGRHHRPARDRGDATRSSSPRTSGTATSTARATPTTASTRSTCGTGARTRCSTSAG